MKEILTLVALAQLVPPVLPANKQQRNERGKTQVLRLAFSLVCYYSLLSLWDLKIGVIDMDSCNNFHFEWGAVTLLDFLGWKGVWMNDYKQQSQSVQFNRNSLQMLASLIQQINDVCTAWCEKNGIKLKFISISDTIALFSPCKGRDNDAENYNMLKLHAELCSKVMDMSADAGFALRGAITIGEYAYLGNIIVGPGVDECASWYEQVDWLGVIFAPSAQFTIDAQRNKDEGERRNRYDEALRKPAFRDQIPWCDEKIVAYRRIPVKNGFHGIDYCVDWGRKAAILNKVLENTISLSREIAIKYINTNKYLYALRPGEETNDENK